MSNKYYAVKNGKTTGIFKEWDDCRNAVEGVCGAVFKSFKTKKEAEAFLRGEVLPKKNAPENLEEEIEKYKIPETIIAFVDGSYDIKTQKYSYGCVLISPNGEITEKNGCGEKDEAKTARNVAGELMGTMAAAVFAAKNGYKNLKIYHDYEGISKWYQKKWKTESFVAKEYMNFMENFRDKINIEFIKVEAHTGIFFNEEADRLAKEALGIT